VQLLRRVFSHAMGAHRKFRCAHRLVHLCGIKSFKLEFLQLEVSARYQARPLFIRCTVDVNA